MPNADLHEGCARRGGVCDCGPRPCFVEFKERWFDAMRDYGVPEAGIKVLWDLARKAGRNA